MSTISQSEAAVRARSRIFLKAKNVRVSHTSAQCDQPVIIQAPSLLGCAPVFWIKIDDTSSIYEDESMSIAAQLFPLACKNTLLIHILNCCPALRVWIIYHCGHAVKLILPKTVSCPVLVYNSPTITPLESLTPRGLICRNFPLPCKWSLKSFLYFPLWPI